MAGTAPAIDGTDAPMRVMLTLLVMIWLCIGLFGRDPWKPDEAYTVGIVYDMVRSGDWVVPKLAGEPFMEKPPLFFVSGALFSLLFDRQLPLHEAARVATVFYVVLSLVFTWLSARTLYGAAAGLPSVLILIGCFGFLQPAHLLVTDNALVAGTAISLYGFVISRTSPALGGAGLGTGLGISFLAKGLVGPVMIAATAIGLLAFRNWRLRTYARSLTVAACVALPFLSIWPLALYERSPLLFDEWLFVNNLGRFTGSADLGPEHDRLMYLKIFPWFALPAWPLAAWTVWHAMRARDGGVRQSLVLPGVAALAMLLVLSLAATQRNLYALPMLVPVSVLAAARIESAPTWLKSGLAWLGSAAGIAASTALLLGWAAMLFGWPHDLATLILSLRPGFSPSVQSWDLVSAISVGAVLLSGLVLSLRRRLSLEAWVFSLTLPWALLFTLWHPYFEHGVSYREIVADLVQQIPEDVTCVAYRNVGEPQRALIDYFGHLTLVPEEKASDCEFLLVQQHGRDPKLPPHSFHWAPAWSGSRPGDSNEGFWLFARDLGPLR